MLGTYSDQVLNAILTMADRRDLLLAQKAEDLRRMVSEMTVIVGKPLTKFSGHASDIRAIGATGAIGPVFD